MRRRLIYVSAVVLLALAVVLAALGVGEQAGKLTDWQAFTLGIVQGVTELLPISSSGHLILVPWLARWHYLEQHPDFNKTFDVALHLGTLVAVVVYFWDEVVSFVAAWFRSVGKRAIADRRRKDRVAHFRRDDPGRRSRAPPASRRSSRTSASRGRSRSTSPSSQALLWVADRSAQTRKLEDIGLWTALGVGAAQAIALMPGVSRSGITITAGRFLKLDRDSAARLSFFLLIPIVFGAVIYKGLKHVVFGEPPVRLDRPVHRRHDRRRGHGPDRDRPPARLPAPPRLLHLRVLPPGPRGRDPDHDRDRSEERDVLM